jgi:Transposase DDE domain
MSAAREDWQILLELFPAGWEELGRSTGAVTRLRGFKSLEALLRTLLLHVGCGWSLRETAVQAKLAGIAEVSDVTLMNRLRQSEDWLRQLCQHLWTDNGMDLEPALKGRPTRLVDATLVREPGPTGGRWRIHYSIRLPSLECDYFELTSGKGKNTGEKLGRFPFRVGELVLADAGYCHPAGVAAVVASGADLCVRLNPASLPLVDERGRVFPLLERLQILEKAGKTGEWQVAIRVGEQQLAGRVCAVRKSEEAIRRAQRRIDKRKQRRVSAGTPETREYANYVLVFTTLKKRQATAPQVLECYRSRWQIELMFKRLKSIVQLGHIPKQDDQSVRAWLYGKLMVALLTQKLVRIGKTISPWGYYLPAEQAGHTQPLA